MLIHGTHADSITIQETKLTPKANTPKVHNFTTMREEIINRLNYSASMLDAEMNGIRVALENASETRDTITTHTDFNILNIRKLDLNTITRVIRDAAS